jgi:hypothetical protein
MTSCQPTARHGGNARFDEERRLSTRNPNHDLFTPVTDDRRSSVRDKPYSADPPTAECGGEEAIAEIVVKTFKLRFPNSGRSPEEIEDFAGCVACALEAKPPARFPSSGVTISDEDFQILVEVFERLTSSFSIDEVSDLLKLENEIWKWLQAIQKGDVTASLGPFPILAK